MRVDGWEARLESVIDAARVARYAFGEHDCFRFACNVVNAVTGIDRWPEFAGRYSDERTAIAMMREYGETYTAALDWFFGSVGVPPAFARRGDVVAASSPHSCFGVALGVCIGIRAAVLIETGVIFLPTSDCAVAWKVD